MTGDFTSFSTVFQSSGRWKDGNERLCAMEITIEKITASGIEFGTARSLARSEGRRL